MNAFSYVFLVCLVATLAFKSWLSWRQLRHVAAHRAQVPDAFAGIISLDQHQKAADYTGARTRLGWVELMVSEGLLLIALTLGGGVAWIDRFMLALCGPGTLRDLGTVFAVAAIGMVVALPFDLWRTFVIEARFGFNKTSLATFVGDLVKGVLLTLALGTPLLVAVFWFVANAGALWWFYTWCAWIAFSLALMWAYPKWLAPLFNKFTPLAEGPVKERIVALLARSGFRAEGLFVMDGSRRSSHGNAYFTGFGKTKRIVFFDTLIERLSIDEVEAVLAHELGHFKRGHIPKLLATRFLLALALLAVLGYVAGEPWFYAGLGVPVGAAAPAIGVTLSLFMLVVGVFTFPFAPIASLISRKHEFEADAFAAAATSADWLASALVKLYRDNAATLTPDPLHSLVYDSHPPASIRIAHLKAAHAAH